MSSEIGHILQCIDDGEIPDDLAARLTSLEMDFQWKAIWLCKARVNAIAEECVIAAEIERLISKRDAARRKAEWIRDYLHESMKRSGLERIEAGMWKLRIQKNSRPSISYEGDTIPPDYVRVTEAFDGARAYDDWKSGLTMPPGVTVKHGEHLRIT